MSFYCCDKCNRKYKTGAMYRKHYLSQHGEDVSILPEMQDIVKQNLRQKEKEILRQDEKLRQEKEILRQQEKEMLRQKDVLEYTFDIIKTNNHTCQICCESTKIVAIIPCGHAVACDKCILICKSCPMCRSLIEKYIKIYT